VIGLDTGVQDFDLRVLLDAGRTIEFAGPADITQEMTDAIVNAANSSLKIYTRAAELQNPNSVSSYII
jgi:hypothetical protein